MKLSEMVEELASTHQTDDPYGDYDVVLHDPVGGEEVEIDKIEWDHNNHKVIIHADS